jgi:hypothetical protein
MVGVSDLKWKREIQSGSRFFVFHFEIFASGFKNNQLSGQLSQIYRSSMLTSQRVYKRKIVPAMPAYKYRDFHQQPSLIHHQFIGDAYEGLERIKIKKKTTVLLRVLPNIDDYRCKWTCRTGFFIELSLIGIIKTIYSHSFAILWCGCGNIGGVVIELTRAS